MKKELKRTVVLYPSNQTRPAEVLMKKELKPCFVLPHLGLPVRPKS